MPSKFKFKLQALLNVKLQMEDSLKNDLGKAIQRLEEEKDILRQLEDEREEQINQLNNQSSQGILVEKLREFNLYLSRLKEKTQLQKENIKYAEQNVDIIREQLIKVVQEREMLEKLKEKKYQEFLTEQFKEEQRLNDELVSYKYSDTSIGE